MKKYILTVCLASVSGLYAADHNRALVQITAKDMGTLRPASIKMCGSKFGFEQAAGATMLASIAFYGYSAVTNPAHALAQTAKWTGTFAAGAFLMALTSD